MHEWLWLQALLAISLQSSATRVEQSSAIQHEHFPHVPLHGVYLNVVAWSLLSLLSIVFGPKRFLSIFFVDPLNFTFSILQWSWLVSLMLPTSEQIIHNELVNAPVLKDSYKCEWDQPERVEQTTNVSQEVEKVVDWALVVLAVQGHFEGDTRLETLYISYWTIHLSRVRETFVRFRWKSYLKQSIICLDQTSIDSKINLSSRVKCYGEVLNLVGLRH